MLDVYKDFYKLTDVPFRLSPDHRFSFEHPSYAQAKAYLEYAIFQGEGFITITGLPGTGKTTLISEILSEVDKSHIRVATITSTQLDARDFLHMVAAAFGLQFGEENKVTLLRALAHLLIQQHQKGLRSVLIVDEAQGLSASALEELRLLANLQHKQNLVLQVCLVGQEQLRDVIAAPEMEHLRQRLIASAHLDPLDLDESITYIEHRLCFAGWQGDPAFTEGALRRIYQASGGIPRRINLICNRMFLYGGLEKKHQLDEEDAERMINELREEMLLAPDGAIETVGADAPDSETDNVVRRLPRGEMLASKQARNKPLPVQHPAEQPAAVKADFFAGVAASMPPEPALQAQPAEVTAQPPPVPPPAQARAVTGGVAASSPPRPTPPVKPAEVTAQPPPARARTVTGGASPAAPEKQPDKPKGGRLRLMAAVATVLLLTASLAFMLKTALQQNQFALVKQAQNDHDVIRREETPAQNLPQATRQPETGNTRVPRQSKPEVGQLSAKAAPYRNASRQDNGAAAVPAPAAKARDAIAGPVTAVDTQEPGLKTPPVAAALETTAQAASVKKAAPVDKPQAAVAKKVAAVEKPQAAVAEKVAAVDKPQAAVAEKVAGVEQPQAAVAEKVAGVDKPQAAVAEKVAGVDKPQAAVAEKVAGVDKPQAAVAEKVAGVDKPQAAVAEKVAGVDKPQAAVAEKVAAIDKPQAAIEAERLPLKDQVKQRADQLLKPAGQSLPGAAKPAAPARPETRVAAATGSPSQSLAMTKSAFTVDEVKSALLAGRWISDGRPASLLPSEVTFCRGARQTINCWSVPQSSDGSDGKVALKVEATLSDFSNTGNFRLLGRRMAKSIGADATNYEPWQVTESQMTCTMVETDKVLCRDLDGNTSEYHLSALSR